MMERPFLPITSSFLFHRGMERLLLLSIVQQSTIELGLLLPIWHCSKPSHAQHWASLLRFLSSTSTCAVLQGFNESENGAPTSFVEVGLKECYVLLPAKRNTSIGLLCRYASHEQLLPPLTTEEALTSAGDIKFDLFARLQRVTPRLLHQVRNDQYSPMDNDSGFIEQMERKIKAL